MSWLSQRAYSRKQYPPRCYFLLDGGTILFRRM